MDSIVRTIQNELRAIERGNKLEFAKIWAKLDDLNVKLDRVLGSELPTSVTTPAKSIGEFEIKVHDNGCRSVLIETKKEPPRGLHRVLPDTPEYPYITAITSTVNGWIIEIAGTESSTDSQIRDAARTILRRL